VGRGILQKNQKKNKEKPQRKNKNSSIVKKCACVLHLIIHYYNARFPTGNGKEKKRKKVKEKRNEKVRTILCYTKDVPECTMLRWFC
jgi:hypothetical protein